MEQLAPRRFFLASDNDGHDYVVPVNKREEWDAWLSLPQDSEEAWNVPEFAMQTEGDLTFTDPKNGE